MGRSRQLRTPASELLLATIIAAAGVYFFSGYFTTVRFDQERIEVKVNRGRILVTGLYHYTNASILPAVLTLKVPFPVDENHPQPDWYGIFESTEDGRAGDEIFPAVRGSDVTIRLLFRPREARWVRLDYEQKARTPLGRYLLTTTQAWRRPIAHAEFLLRLPRDFDLVDSNYPVSPRTLEGPWKTYAFSKTEFFPATDWEFSWHEPSAEAAMRGGEWP